MVRKMKGGTSINSDSGSGSGSEKVDAKGRTGTAVIHVKKEENYSAMHHHHPSTLGIITASDNGTASPIFAGLTIYINGSTMPLISDHKLRHLLVSHGARIAISLTRRSVTHVIIGRPNKHKPSGSGAGGGLAAGKFQREIGSVGRGRAVKIVGVEWCVLPNRLLFYYSFFRGYCREVMLILYSNSGLWRVSRLRNVSLKRDSRC